MRSVPACVVVFDVPVRGFVTINRLLPFAMGQYLIVNGKIGLCNALQALVLDAVSW